MYYIINRLEKFKKFLCCKLINGTVCIQKVSLILNFPVFLLAWKVAENSSMVSKEFHLVIYECQNYNFTCLILSIAIKLQALHIIQ